MYVGCFVKWYGFDVMILWLVRFENCSLNEIVYSV